MNVKTKLNLHHMYCRRVLLFGYLLLCMIILVSSCFVSVFSGVSPFASGYAEQVVKDETELKNAVNNATEQTIIKLDKDITLISSLIIL